jgi:glutamyl-tRNA reductase
MFEQLTVIEWPSNKVFDQDLIKGSQAFCLSTCQRSLIASLDSDCAVSSFAGGRLLHSNAAYSYLLSIVCGLQSRLLGETEIVAQYRTSLMNYSSSPWRNSSLLRILERILKDAKEVRTQHLQQIGQYSYAGLSKKLLLERTPRENVLILGSGALAEDLSKVLNRHFPVHILARNRERTENLIQRYKIFNAGDWSQWQQIVKGHKAVINTIPNFPHQETHDLIHTWNYTQSDSSRLWIDLSNSPAPNDIKPLPSSVITLGHLFELGAELTKEKENKVHHARMALDQIVSKRYQLIQQENINVAIASGTYFAHAGDQI